MLKLLVFCLCIAAASCAFSWWPPMHDDTCKYTRTDALNCAIKYGDINKDGKLTRAEVEEALDSLVPGWIRKIPAILTGVDADRVMRDCDYNKDGVLTPRDWELAKKTCMPLQRNLCMFKWFCDRAAERPTGK